MAGAQSSSPSSSTPVSSQMRGPPESKGDNRTDSNQEGKGKGKENEKGNKTVETSGLSLSTTDARRKDAGKKARDVVGVQSCGPSSSTPSGSQIRRSSKSKGDSGTDSNHQPKSNEESKGEKMVETSGSGTSTINDSRKFAE